MFCTKCGKPLSEGANFCAACGIPVENNSTLASSIPSSPPSKAASSEPIPAHLTDSNMDGRSGEAPSLPEPQKPTIQSSHDSVIHSSHRPFRWPWVMGAVVMVVVGFAVIKKNRWNEKTKPMDVSQTALSLIDPLTNQPTGLDSSYKLILDFRVTDFGDIQPKNRVNGAIATEIKRYFKEKFKRHDPIEITSGPSGAFFEQNSLQQLFIVTRQDKTHNYAAAGYGLSYFILAYDHGNWSDFATDKIDSLRTSDYLVVDGIQCLMALSAYAGGGECGKDASIISLKNKVLKVINKNIAGSADGGGISGPSYVLDDTAYVKKVGDNLEFKKITWVEREEWKGYRLYDEASFNKEQDDLKEKMQADSNTCGTPIAPVTAIPQQMSRVDFTNAVMGKTQQEVMAKVGKPDSTVQVSAMEGKCEVWMYNELTYHPVTKQLDHGIGVRFLESTNRVIKVDF